MKKMRIALASMLVAAGITATAGAANFTNCADRLKDVGLFQGTNQGYQLDKAPTPCRGFGNAGPSAGQGG